MSTRRWGAERLKRWWVAVETALIVAAIVLIKLVVEAFSGDFIALSPLYTSVVAGGILVIELLVAGTLVSPAFVDSVRGRDPLRSLTRDSPRSYRAAPITSAASASNKLLQHRTDRLADQVDRFAGT